MLTLRASLSKGVTVASLTIRTIEDDVKSRLRIRAAEHGRSLEEEVRDILRRSVGDAPPPEDLG